MIRRGQCSGGFFYPNFIASEAKQCSFPTRCSMDCFASLAMTEAGRAGDD